MKVRITSAARDDLEAICRWIARADPVVALRFTQELRARIASLRTMPERFPVAYRGKGAPVLRMNHRGYRVFFHIVDGEVEVVGVQHGARAAPDLR